MGKSIICSNNLDVNLILLLEPYGRESSPFRVGHQQSVVPPDIHHPLHEQDRSLCRQATQSTTGKVLPRLHRQVK